MSTELVHVPFHGGEILAVKSEQGEFAVIKPLCESIGIDANGQVQRLKRQSWAQGACLLHVPTAGGVQEMFCLPRNRLSMWLVTLDASRVRPEARPHLELLQNEAADVLDAYFIGEQRSGLNVAELKKITDAYEQQIADLRRQLSARSAPPSLRPTDIAAAWARAHLEQGKEPMLLRDAWARYVEWSQEQGLPMPLHLSTLSYGLAALFHQSKTRGAVAYYCQLRAQPLPVDLPQRAQQSLPLPAAEPDAADLADRTLRLLARGDLPAFGVAEILGIKEYEAAAVLGPLVEAGAIHGKARGGRMFYAVDFKRGADLRDRVAHVIGDKPETTMVEVAQALGLDPASRAVQMQIGLAMRDLGYVRHRSGAAGRPYVYRKGEAN